MKSERDHDSLPTFSFDDLITAELVMESRTMVNVLTVALVVTQWNNAQEIGIVTARTVEVVMNTTNRKDETTFGVEFTLGRGARK